MSAVHFAPLFPHPSNIPSPDGGAGNITRANLPPPAQAAYKATLVRILEHASSLLNNGASALTAATTAVSQLEECALFNCGHGAVFTRAGTIELEASVMVSRGYKKRGAAVSLLKHVRNPILFVKEVLERGEDDLEPETGMLEEEHAERETVSAQGHVHISGPEAERLAKAWGLELMDEKYFWTKKRWEEHKRGLKKRSSRYQNDREEIQWEDHFSTDSLRTVEVGWDGHDYLPQGTVGCVALDDQGVLCVATSTGGLTNKLPGRIGDTPTFGAGFWADEGFLRKPRSSSAPSVHRLLGSVPHLPALQSLSSIISPSFASTISSCLPQLRLPNYQPLHTYSESQTEKSSHESKPIANIHAIALSGTGNGDSFLRLSACRTASALSLPPLVHFPPPPSEPGRLNNPRRLPPAPPTLPLPLATHLVAGPGGLLQRSAGDRWKKGTFEGEGGMIGIEFKAYGDEEGEEGFVRQGQVAWVFNCSGMWRAWVDEGGESRVRVFADEDE